MRDERAEAQLGVTAHAPTHSPSRQTSLTSHIPHTQAAPPNDATAKMNLLQMRRQILELRRARDAAMVMKAARLARDAAGGSPIPNRPPAPTEADAEATSAAAAVVSDADDGAPASPPASPTAPTAGVEGVAPSLATAVEGSLLELVHTLQAERLQVSDMRERERESWTLQCIINAGRRDADCLYTSPQLTNTRVLGLGT